MADPARQFTLPGGAFLNATSQGQYALPPSWPLGGLPYYVSEQQVRGHFSLTSTPYFSWWLGKPA